MLHESAKDLLKYLEEKGFPMKTQEPSYKKLNTNIVHKISNSNYEISEPNELPIVINSGSILLNAINTSANALHIKLFE
jgi:hypothetical protein